MASSDVIGLFRDLICRDDESIHVPSAALAIARIAYPSLALDGYLGELAALGEAAAQRTRSASSAEARITRLNQYVFAELGFRGNRQDYYDPRNSFLNDVLERRLGIPITLALVYIELATSCGITVQGIGFPGHFLVRDVATGWFLDVFNAAGRLEIADCKELFIAQGHRAEQWNDELLAGVSKRQLLLRMIRNLHRYYSQAGDPERISTLEAMASAITDNTEEASSRLH